MKKVLFEKKEREKNPKACKEIFFSNEYFSENFLNIQ